MVPIFLWPHTPIPHAETKAQLLTRVEKFLKDTAQQQKGKIVIIVTHGGVIKTLITHYTETAESPQIAALLNFTVAIAVILFRLRESSE